MQLSGDKKWTIRGLLIGYPVFALVLYLMCSVFPRMHLETVQEKVQDIKQSGKLTERRFQAEKKRQAQRGRMEQVIKQFHASANLVDSAAVASYVSRFTQEGAVELLNFKVGGEEKLYCCQSVLIGLSVEGTYERIVKFMRKLTLDEDTVIYVRSFTLGPGGGPSSRKTDLEIAVVTEL